MAISDLHVTADDLTSNHCCRDSKSHTPRLEPDRAKTESRAQALPTTAGSQSTVRPSRCKFTVETWRPFVGILNEAPPEAST